MSFSRSVRGGYPVVTSLMNIMRGVCRCVPGHDVSLHFLPDRLPKADVNWLSQQLTTVVDSLMPTSEECARQAAAFDKVSARRRVQFMALC